MTTLRNIDIDLLRSFVTIAELRSASPARPRRSFRTPVDDLDAESASSRSSPARPCCSARRTRCVLTRAGEDFLGYARRIVALHDEALDVVNGPRASPARSGSP
jgi:hypothetical protein